jgi:hypothetical protein
MAKQRQDQGKERLMATARLLGASGLIAGMMLAGGIDQARAQTKDITVILPNPSAIACSRCTARSARAILAMRA